MDEEEVMKRFQLAGLVLAVAALSGCAANSQKFTAKERMKLETMEIVATDQENFAYREPNGATNNGLSVAVPAATAGGAIPALVGLLAEGAVQSMQNSSYRKGNEQYFEAVEKNMPADLLERVNTVFADSLKANKRLASLIAEESANKVSMSYVSFGLVRKNHVKGKYFMAISLNATVNVSSPEDKEVLNRPVFGTSEKAFTTQELAEDPAKVSQLVDEAIEAFKVSLSFALEDSMN